MLIQKQTPIFALVFILLAACGPVTSYIPAATATISLPTATFTPTAIPATATPEPTSTPIPAGCVEQHGKVDSDVIETRLLDKPMRYRVYLPPCYASETGERYPVLYLLHGQNFDENQWLRMGLAERMDELLAQGKIQPFIVVMPYDYSYKQPSEYGFQEAFVTLLLPKIEASYRTRPQRAIGGLSRGGAWAIYIGTRHPTLFGKIGAHSPALFYSDMGNLPVRLRDLAAITNPPLFYVDAGDSDVEFEGVQAFSDQLNKLNLPYEWHYNVGFHDEKYWAKHLVNYLRWYAWQ